MEICFVFQPNGIIALMISVNLFQALKGSFRMIDDTIIEKFLQINLFNPVSKLLAVNATVPTVIHGYVFHKVTTCAGMVLGNFFITKLLVLSLCFTQVMECCCSKLSEPCHGNFKLVRIVKFVYI